MFSRSFWQGLLAIVVIVGSAMLVLAVMPTRHDDSAPKKSPTAISVVGQTGQANTPKR